LDTVQTLKRDYRATDMHIKCINLTLYAPLEHISLQTELVTVGGVAQW